MTKDPSADPETQRALLDLAEALGRYLSMTAAGAASEAAGDPEARKREPRSPLPFKQTEIERMIRSVQNTGLPIRRVEIDAFTGAIRVLTETADDRYLSDLEISARQIEAAFGGGPL